MYWVSSLEIQESRIVSRMEEQVSRPLNFFRGSRSEILRFTKRDFSKTKHQTKALDMLPPLFAQQTQTYMYVKMNFNLRSERIEVFNCFKQGKWNALYPICILISHYKSILTTVLLLDNSSDNSNLLNKLIPGLHVKHWCMHPLCM